MKKHLVRNKSSEKWMSKNPPKIYQPLVNSAAFSSAAVPTEHFFYGQNGDISRQKGTKEVIAMSLDGENIPNDLLNGDEWIVSFRSALATGITKANNPGPYMDAQSAAQWDVPNPDKLSIDDIDAEDLQYNSLTGMLHPTDYHIYCTTDYNDAANTTHDKAIIIDPETMELIYGSNGIHSFPTYQNDKSLGFRNNGLDLGYFVRSYTNIFTVTYDQTPFLVTSDEDDNLFSKQDVSGPEKLGIPGLIYPHPFFIETAWIDIEEKKLNLAIVHTAGQGETVTSLYDLDVVITKISGPDPDYNPTPSENITAP